MCTGSITPAVYTLDESKSNWSAEQEKRLSTIYPFDLNPSGPDDYVARTYLQYLWLPNSLMPLTYLVPSLRRVASSASSTTDTHPMHLFLRPLLLTTHSVTNKYHSELVHVLANGGGAGEMEEAMMWYAVEHEKPLDYDKLSGPSIQKHGQNGEEGHWTDEKWREQYLERMERREVQIQILLYMFKLSLPGPCFHLSSPDFDDTSKPSRPGKRKRMLPVVIEPTLTVEDHLEAFMDKLAMWQLVERIDDNHPKNDERDWTQIFAEDVVESQFKAQLPDLCKLLRTKVFSTSPFSDAELDALPTSITPPEPTDVPRSPTMIPNPPLKTALSRTSSTSFSFAPPRAASLIPSPARCTSSRNLMRSRSSSLSISLAQEKEERAAAAAAAAEQQTRKTGRFHREVSMTRVFKNKGKGKGKLSRGPDAEVKKATSTAKVDGPKVEKALGERGVTLVDDTPIKTRTSSTSEKTNNTLIEPLNLGMTRAKPDPSGDNDLTARMFIEDEDQDDEWMMDSSPAVVVFDLMLEKEKDKASGITAAEGSDGSEEEWDKEFAAQMTPIRSQPRKRPRKK